MKVKFSHQFKKPFDNIGNLMPIGFSDDEYVTLFSKLYQYLWLEIEKEYLFWKSKNDFILKLGKKSRYNFPKPYNFVLKTSIHIRRKYQHNHSQENCLEKFEQEKLIQKLIENNSQQSSQRIKKEKDKLKLTQEIEPSHVNLYIDKYFKTKICSQKDVDDKFEIIREISKYKTAKTISFLQKVNAGERNFSLREVAFRYLQQMDEKVILRRNKKGKKKPFVDLNLNSEHNTNPDSLIESLYENSFEKIKEYDVFLSHSSKNSDKVIDIFKKLNKNNLHVYIDWVNDRYALKRELINQNTAKVIAERLNKSRFLFYFHTEESSISQWTAWEIGYFHGLGKMIFIFNPDNITLPYFLQIYQPVIYVEQKFFYLANGKREEIKSLEEIL